jgi:hypothetical protein
MHYGRLIATALLAATLGSGQPPAVRPSNGVVELSATPLPDPDTRPAGNASSTTFRGAELCK